MPGMKQFRGRRGGGGFMPFRSRRPFPPPYFFNPYGGYGYVTKFSWVVDLSFVFLCYACSRIGVSAIVF